MKTNWVIITDLDGTFLSARDYDYSSLCPAVEALREARIPIVFCSSKTRAEILGLRQELGIRDPFIVENGGAIYVEDDYFPFPLSGALKREGMLAILLGTPHSVLVQALDEVESQTQCLIQRFGRLSDEDLGRQTGLSPAEASLAKEREFDEPFWFLTPSTSKPKLFLRRLRRLPGLRVTRGNRFYHLKGLADKGRAVEILKAYYRQLWPAARFIGLGDSVNDIPMLRAVDIPVVVRGPNGRLSREIISQLPHVVRSPMPAPQGWWASVLPLVSRSLFPSKVGPETREDRGI